MDKAINIRTLKIIHRTYVTSDKLKKMKAKS